MYMYMYISGLVVYCFNCMHFLMLLISLEIIIISLYSCFFLFLGFSSSYFFSMIFLSISVCEGSLGLSILVSLIRSHGSDYLQSMNILW